MILPSGLSNSKSDLCCRIKERIDEFETVDKEITGRSTVSEPASDEEFIIQAPDLQVACSLPLVSARELQAILDSSPIAASETDREGRYPLHILSENETLLASFAGSKDAEDFCLNLFEAYPEAIIIRDNTSSPFPFVHSIQNWVEDSYHRMNQSDTKPRKGLIRTIRSSRGKLSSLFGSDSEHDRRVPESTAKPRMLSVMPG